MPETWQDLANSNRATAQNLVASRAVAVAHRSVANRAYYAVYAKLTFELLRLGYTPPQGRQGPSHAELRGRLMLAYFKQRYPQDWSSLDAYVRQSYDLRVVADYQPSTDFDEFDARQALYFMKRVFDFF